MGALYYMKTKQNPPITPFHVSVDPVTMPVAGIDIFPLFRGVMTAIPDSVKQSLLVKLSAPDPKNPRRDKFDCTGESPYCIQEVKEGKVWKVGYHLENGIFTDPKDKEGMKNLGIDFSSEKFREKVRAAAAKYGEEMVRQVEEDFKTATFWAEKEFISKEEVFQIPPFTINCLVVRLLSGGLLLYAPVKIQDELFTWLADLGTVEWIIVPSSAHTLCLPNVLEKFPEAKIAGPSFAELKLQSVNALPRGKFDFVTSREEDVKNINNVLEKEGVSVHSVTGDVAAHSVIVVAHRTLLECDLIYGHHDKEGSLLVDKETFRQLLPSDWPTRMFKLGLIDNSPHGHLPNYRYWLMDPQSMGFMTCPPCPAPDGSSCLTMASSLRTILDQDYDLAVGVHINPMDRDKFRSSMDSCWNWLDGKSLI